MPGPSKTNVAIPPTTTRRLVENEATIAYGGLCRFEPGTYRLDRRTAHAVRSAHWPIRAGLCVLQRSEERTLLSVTTPFDIHFADRVLRPGSYVVDAITVALVRRSQPDLTRNGAIRVCGLADGEDSPEGVQDLVTAAPERTLASVQSDRVGASGLDSGLDWRAALAVYGGGTFAMR